MNNLYAEAKKNNETDDFFSGLGVYELNTPDCGVIAAGHIGHIKSYLDKYPEKEHEVYDSLTSYISQASNTPEGLRFVLANIYSFINFREKGFPVFGKFLQNTDDKIYLEFTSYLLSFNVMAEHMPQIHHYSRLLSKTSDKLIVQILQDIVNAN